MRWDVMGQAWIAMGWDGMGQKKCPMDKPANFVWKLDLEVTFWTGI